MTTPFKALICAAVLTVSVPACAGADDPAQWQTCADEASGPRHAGEEDAVLGGPPPSPEDLSGENPELYQHAKFLGSAYAMLAAEEAGDDPRTAFPDDELEVTALIHGSPDKVVNARTVRADRQTLYGYMARHRESGVQYVVLRGTVLPSEWVRNAQARQVDFPERRLRRGDPQVHRGFNKIYKSLEAETTEGPAPLPTALENLFDSQTQTVFVGHSLGGALATLAAVEAGYTGRLTPEAIRVVTIASPRVGDAVFRDRAEQSTARIDRICNMPDAVPHVPVSTRRLDYVHVGRLWRYSSLAHPDTLVTSFDKQGEAIGCWHNTDVYAWMLDNGHSGRSDPACWR